jgi:hypothetical protein
MRVSRQKTKARARGAVTRAFISAPDILAKRGNPPDVLLEQA